MVAFDGVREMSVFVRMMEGSAAVSAERKTIILDAT